MATLIDISKPIDIGQASSFEAVYLRFYSPLCHFAAKYLLQLGDAEDVVAGLFTKCWNDKATFDNFDHLRNYLYKATYHACLNHLRGNQRSTRRKLELAAELTELGEDYWADVIRAELVSKIFEAIHSLPTKYAGVMHLAFAEELKNEEIAERLNLSLQTVKNYKSSGLEILRKRISPLMLLLLLSVIP